MRSDGLVISSIVFSSYYVDLGSAIFDRMLSRGRFLREGQRHGAYRGVFDRMDGMLSGMSSEERLFYNRCARGPCGRGWRGYVWVC